MPCPEVVALVEDPPGVGVGRHQVRPVGAEEDGTGSAARCEDGTEAPERRGVAYGITCGVDRPQGPGRHM